MRSRTRLPLFLLLCVPLLTGASSLQPPELHEAIATRDRLRAEQLLADGVDLEQRDAFGRTPLYVASRSGDAELVRALLARGADIDAANLAGLTPLHAAAARGHREAARLLLVNCARIEARDQLRRTPLHMAAARGRTEIAQLLIESGADVQARLRSGQTPFGLAIARQQPEAVSFLRSQLPPVPVSEDELAETGEEDGETPAEPTPAVAAAPERPERPRGTEGTTRFLQEKLGELGYDAGPVNGRRTAQLIDAVRAYQDAAGVVRASERGQISRCLVDRLGIEISSAEATPAR